MCRKLSVLSLSFAAEGPTLVKKSEAAELQLDGPEKTKGRVARPFKAELVAPSDHSLCTHNHSHPELYLLV